ncbi:MAG: MurT ligase domain-containing protein [Acidimicrobiales bacterium]
MGTGRTLRERVAVGALRGVNWASRTTKRGAGTVAGGHVGLRIAPDLLSVLAQDREIIVVSGTNGKTTTTALCVAGWGGSVVTNQTGANMPAGHVAALAGSREQRVVLEADEAWLPEVVRSARPRVVVLLNLSRDQLDRANEVRQMAERWRRCFAAPQNADVLVVANANDPLVVYAASDAAKVRWCDVATPWSGDAQSCPRCTLPLTHSSTTWSCTCGLAKPVELTTIVGDELSVDAETIALDLSLPGEFNRANAAMAVTALVGVGVALAESVARLKAVTGVAGRYTWRAWNGHRLRLLLAKNPAGFDALLTTVPEGDGDVWVAINANIADGRDPSWLYDVAFERLAGHRVWCLGDRRLDLATRLDYAGVEYRIADDLAQVPVSDQPVDLLANYTSFQEWMARSTPC